MRVIISVFGKFHAFSLAEQLQRKKCLSKLYTTYPKHLISKKYKISKKNISSIILFEIIWRTFRNTLSSKAKLFLNYYLKIIYDFLISFSLNRKTSIFIGWSSSSLFCLKKSKKLGIITILERGSTHIIEQNNILKKEYEKFNLRFPDQIKFIERELQEYELADYISIPSIFVKDSFIKNGIPEDKLLLNPYGANLVQFSKKKKEDNKFRYIFVGNFSIRKGSHYLIKALSEMENLNFEFWHIGGIDKNMYPFLKKYKSDNMHFLGVKKNNELAYYYSQSNVFVLPSLEEGLALVIQEAMSCCLPIICTQNTGASTVIEDESEGFIIPPGNEKILKEKLLWCLNNKKKCREMGIKASTKVLENYKWEDYGNKYHQNLQKIINNF